MRKYINISLAALLAIVLVWMTTSDSMKTNETAQSSTTTLPLFVREPVSTYVKNEETELIPNPCSTISIENVAQYVPYSVVRGPLVQSAQVATKSCEWTPSEGAQMPRMGVSLATSLEAFDVLEKRAVETADLGTQSYILNEYTTSVGGASCGKTIVVETEQYSYLIAICKQDNAEPTTDELIGLAKDVLDSLS